MPAKPVRHCSKDPTPFLRDMCERGFLDSAKPTCCHAPMPIVFDLGAGNLRNTRYLRSKGFSVQALDANPDYRGVYYWRAGVDSIPAVAASLSLVLCQYLLMFLGDGSIRHLLSEIDIVLMPGGLLLVELEDIKQGRKVHMHKVLEYLGMPSKYKAIRSTAKHSLIEKL